MFRTVVLLVLLCAVLGCASDNTSTSERKRRSAQPSYTCAEIVDALRQRGTYVDELEIHNPSPRHRNEVSDTQDTMGSRYENQLKVLYRRKNC